MKSIFLHVFFKIFLNFENLRISFFVCTNYLVFLHEKLRSHIIFSINSTQCFLSSNRTIQIFAKQFCLFINMSTLQ